MSLIYTCINSFYPDLRGSFTCASFHATFDHPKLILKTQTQQGLDEVHTKLALDELAKYHAVTHAFIVSKAKESTIEAALKVSTSTVTNLEAIIEGCGIESDIYFATSGVLHIKIFPCLVGWVMGNIKSCKI